MSSNPAPEPELVTPSAVQLFGPFSALSIAASVVGAAANVATAQYAVGGVFFAGAALTLLNWIFARGRVSTGAVHGLIGALFFMLTGANLLTGGFGLPAHFAMGLVPAAAVMMGGLRSGWPWLFASVAEVGLVAALHAADVQFPAVPPASKALPLQTIGALVTLGATFLLAAVFAVDRRRKSARLAEALREARSVDVAKSRFLANVSHELRTPMNGVLGMLDALLASDLDDGQAECAETAHGSARDLLRLMNGIFDLTRLEIAQLEIEREPVDPARLVREVVRRHAPAAATKGIALTTELPETPAEGVMLDPLRVTQIITHVLDNAIEFTDDGEIAVELEVVPEPERTTVLVRVRDTGEGITSTDLERIFQPFAQGDESSTREHSGAGLGLTIARRLCEAMDGDLVATSVPNRGSTFTAILRGAPADLPPTELRTRDLPRLAGARVLVVEDHPINRVVMQRLLERRGVEVHVAMDGQEAVDRVVAELFDLVLMDWHMPRLDGLAATRTLRAHPGAAREVPIVAVTASTMPGDRELCLEAGMDDFLSKPVTPSDLDRVLRRFVSERRQAADAPALDAPVET